MIPHSYFNKVLQLNFRSSGYPLGRGTLGLYERKSKPIEEKG